MKRTIYDCWKCRHHNSDNPYGIDYCEAHDTRCSFAHDDCDNFEPDTDTVGNDIQTEPSRGLTVIGWYLLAVAVAILLACLLTGCTTTKYVPVVEHKTDTLMKYSTIRDSIYLSDSIYVSDFVRDDTVYKTTERWHTKYIERMSHDTLYQSKVDSIPYPVEVTKEVPAKLTWWQQTRLHIINVLMMFGIIWLIVWIGRKHISILRGE